MIPAKRMPVIFPSSNFLGINHPTGGSIISTIWNTETWMYMGPNFLLSGVMNLIWCFYLFIYLLCIIFVYLYVWLFTCSLVLRHVFLINDTLTQDSLLSGDLKIPFLFLTNGGFTFVSKNCIEFLKADCGAFSQIPSPFRKMYF